MNVPKLRFSEFNDSYILDTYDNVINIIDGDRGNNYPKESDFYDDEYCLFLNAGNVTKNGFNFSNKSFITLKKDNELRNGKLRRNDVVLTTRGTVGNVALYDDSISFENIRINSGMVINRIKCNKLLPQYLYQFMQSSIFDFQVKKANFGSAQPQLTKKGIAKFNIAYPSIKEQRKVCNFLTLLDKKIELQAKRIEALKLFTKKIILDTLNKENNFESKYFKEVCTIQTGKSNTQDKDDNGIYPFYIRSENIEHSKKYIFDCEAVITIGDGKIGKIFFYENGKFDCHQRVYVLNNFKEVTGKYLYYYFSTFFYRRAISMSAKNTVDSVRMEMISNMSIKIPSIEEQERITKIFDNLELKKKLETSKLEKLNYLKKGLLQNMFV